LDPVPLSGGDPPRAEAQGLPRLDEKWRGLFKEIAYQPKLVQEELMHIPTDDSGKFLHSAVFIHTARAMDYLQSGQNRLLTLVNEEGKIRWRELIDVLPKSERASITSHPKVRLTGTLPPHLSITRMDKVKMPSPGILLTTESGFHLHIGSKNSLLISLIWDQLEGFKHPTWSELVENLQLPRKLEMAESTAFEVLRSYSEQSGRLKELTDLLAACRLF
jgi:hypothetical protein